MGQLQCACPAVPAPDASVAEPFIEQAPESDAIERKSFFECPSLRNQPCQSDQDCAAPKPPPPKKPYCPRQYCGEDAIHGRSVATDPTTPGTLPWDRGFYPARDDCECKVECASLFCRQGRCQPPAAEAPPEPPPQPDQPPGCPQTCQSDADCPESLCSDRTTCDPEKKVCINPFVRP